MRCLLVLLSLLVFAACGDVKITTQGGPQSCLEDSECQSGDECRAGSCSDGACVFSVLPDWCYASEQCFQVGQEMPGDRCKSCVPDLIQEGLVSKSCEAGLVCEASTGECVAPEPDVITSDATPTDATGADATESDATSAEINPTDSEAQDGTSSDTAAADTGTEDAEPADTGGEDAVSADAVFDTFIPDAEPDELAGVEDTGKEDLGPEEDTNKPDAESEDVDPGDVAPDACGDGVCDPKVEGCDSCPLDCGPCPTCKKYCAQYLELCPQFLEYKDKDDCVSYCKDYAALPVGAMGDKELNTVGCRLKVLNELEGALAAGAGIKTIHKLCQEAGKSGNGVCGDLCTNYCDVAVKNCQDVGVLGAQSFEFCFETCSELFLVGFSVGEPGAEFGGSYQCRFTYAGRAAEPGADKEAYCEEAAGISPKVCAGKVPTHAKEVGGILQEHCNPCHTGDAAGGHSIAVSYFDAWLPSYHCPGKSKGACAIIRIAEGSMPKNAPGSVDDESLNILKQWLAGGMPP